MDGHQFSHSSMVNAPHGGTAIESPTYVGKVADVHFIYAVRQCLQGQDYLFVGEGSAS